MADIPDSVTVGYSISREPINVDISHSHQMKTYSNLEFLDDSFVCFISSQEFNVLFLLACLQMREPGGGGQLDYYNHPKWAADFLLSKNILTFLLPYSTICP